MNALKVINVEDRLKNGYTTPFLVTCEDQNQYVLKSTSHETETTDGINSKALFNELFAARLAKQLNINIPEFGIAFLSRELIDKNDSMLECKIHSGYCFISKYHTGQADISTPLLRICKNKEMIPSMILFDQLVLNRDRGDKKDNIFFDRKTKSFFLIDHTDIFENGQIWTKNDLIQRSNCHPPYLSGEIKGDCYKYMATCVHGENDFRNIKKAIKKINYDSLIADIPNEWNISNSDKRAAIDFLSGRTNEIDDIIKELHEQIFTKWKGVS